MPAVDPTVNVRVLVASTYATFEIVVTSVAYNSSRFPFESIRYVEINGVEAADKVTEFPIFGRPAELAVRVNRLWTNFCCVSPFPKNNVLPTDWKKVCPAPGGFA